MPSPFPNHRTAGESVAHTGQSLCEKLTVLHRCSPRVHFRFLGNVTGKQIAEELPIGCRCDKVIGTEAGVNGERGVTI